MKKTKAKNGLKNQKAITLIALIVTIVVLLILAGITIGTLTGNNGIINSAIKSKEKSEIENEKEVLELATIQSMGKERYGQITQLGLQTQLDYNTGKGATKVTDEEETLLTKFIISERIYEVDEDGNIKYLGKESDLVNQVDISASPSSNTKPQLVQEAEITLKTVFGMEDSEITLVYAWNQSESESPEKEEYVKASLGGTKRTKKATVYSDATIAGDYYLWVKAIIGESEITKSFGPYTIKNHTTLASTKDEQTAEAGFLGNTDITRNKIKKVAIETSLGGHTTSDEKCWDVSESQDETYLAWYETDSDGNYSVTIAGEGGVVANSNSSFLFAHIGYALDETTIEGLENLDTGLVTTMSRMFQNCKNIENLDLKSFDTRKVTSFYAMFNGCTNLIYLDISGFNTGNAVLAGMISMFNGCSSLTYVDVSNFDTSNVTIMSHMFAGCNKLNNIDVSNWNTSNISNMSSAFAGCSKLVNLDVSKWNTSNVKDFSRIFLSCANLININIQSWDTSSATTMTRMFYACEKLTNIDVSNFNTINVNNMSYMFYSCKGLNELNVNNLETDNVNYMESMFCRCSGLTSLDLSNFNTANVYTMQELVASCSNLKTISLSNFNTINVNNMASMFYSCNSLENIDVSNFNTSNVTNMSYMFAGCKILTTLDLSNFSTENLQDITGMLYSCTNLSQLMINQFDLEKISNIGDACFTYVPEDVAITTTQGTVNYMAINWPQYTNITVVE